MTYTSFFSVPKCSFRSFSVACVLSLVGPLSTLKYKWQTCIVVTPISSLLNHLRLADNFWASYWIFIPQNGFTSSWEVSLKYPSLANNLVNPSPSVKSFKLRPPCPTLSEVITLLAVNIIRIRNVSWRTRTLFLWPTSKIAILAIFCLRFRELHILRYF